MPKKNKSETTREMETALVKIEKEEYTPIFDEITGEYKDECPYPLNEHNTNRIIYTCRCNYSTRITNRAQFNSHVRGKGHKDLVKDYKEIIKPQEDLEKKCKKLEAKCIKYKMKSRKEKREHAEFREKVHESIEERVQERLKEKESERRRSIKNDKNKKKGK